MSTATKANWRQIAVGMPVWYQHRNKWIPALVLELNNRKNDQAKARVGSGAGVWKHVSELYWRKPALNGADMPNDREMHLAAIAGQ